MFHPTLTDFVVHEITYDYLIVKNDIVISKEGIDPVNVMVGWLEMIVIANNAFDSSDHFIRELRNYCCFHDIFSIIG